MPSNATSRRPKQVATSRCRQCDREQRECGPLSSRRLCVECGDENMNRAARELAAGEGPAYDEWRRAVIANARRLSRE